MASLSVRKLDDNTYECLRARAARHGVSMEEEVRLILKRETATPERVGDLFLKYFGSANGTTIELSTKKPHEPINLSK